MDEALKAERNGTAPDPAALAAMLAAREERWQTRLALSESCPALASVTLCVPLPLRTSPEGRSFLLSQAASLREALLQAGFAPKEPRILEGADGTAVFLSCGGDAAALKRFCVEREEASPAGRLLDIDVTAPGGVPIGRAELGLPPRRCFLCGRPAAECVSQGRHPPQAVARYVRTFMVS